MDTNHSEKRSRRREFEIGDSIQGQDAKKSGTKRLAYGRKRGRHAAACVSCHRRKQRCDGARPCYNCNRRNVGSSCRYNNDLDGIRTSTSPSVRAKGSPIRPSQSSPFNVISPPASAGHEHPNAPIGDEATHQNLPEQSSLGESAQGPPQAVQVTQQSHSNVSDPPEVGDLFRNRDAPSFFGSSYFGPQAAAKIIEAPDPELSSGLPNKPLASSAHSFRDEGGPFSQIWDLLGVLPRKRSTVDRLTTCFLAELNWAIDAVQEACFKEKYEIFWSRKFGFDDLSTIDLRWLALLFIVLAYGVLLDCPEPKNKDAQRELQETSLRFYWAARRAIVISPTFYGESTDLVRAGILVTRYLIYSRRVPESWLTTSFAMRMAQAQGIHIDGERWRLSRKKTESHRRMWSNLYMLDKSIALAIGRPYAIVDHQCLVKQASNLWLDNLSDEEAETVAELPLTEPTLAICNRLSHDLAIIIGKIQERCFGLFTVSYEAVLSLDRDLLTWEEKLPTYFKLQDPDLSLDSQRRFLFWNRLHLHSMYHFARVTLHRPFLLRQSITNRYKHSHDVCIASACADLDMRLKYFSQPLTDRLKWTLGPHHMFNSALVLGIIAVREPFSRRTQAILEDLGAYCEMQRNDIWLNEFALAEVKIVELCIKKARQKRNANTQSHGGAPVTGLPVGATQNSSVIPALPDLVASGQISLKPVEDEARTAPSAIESFSMNTLPSMGPMLFDGDPTYAFPETGDLMQWEQILNSIMNDQMSG